jgi:hypothetical protein
LEVENVDGQGSPLVENDFEKLQTRFLEEAEEKGSTLLMNCHFVSTGNKGLLIGGTKNCPLLYFQENSLWYMLRLKYQIHEDLKFHLLFD